MSLGGGLVVDQLRRTGPGRYETTRPLPLGGDWKTLIRLHEGDSLTGLPIYLPRDEAIPAPEVPARPRFERPFVADHRILQREQRPAPAALTVAAYGAVLVIALALLALLAWGLHRLASPTGGVTPYRRPLKAPRAMAPIGHTGQK